MAQKVNIILVDDIDGSDATQTVSFGLDGANYEIDLNDKNASKLPDALAAYVGSLGTGPAIPDADMYDPSTLSGDEYQDYVTRGGQIFLANCTACHNFEGSGGAMPRGGYAPKIRGVDPRYIYEAMLTGPQSMDTFSDGNIPPDDKKAVIAYLDSLNNSPSYGGLTLGGLGPVSEGIIAWVVGIGLCVGFAVWIAAHTTRSSKKKDEVQA